MQDHGSHLNHAQFKFLQQTTALVNIIIMGVEKELNVQEMYYQPKREPSPNNNEPTPLRAGARPFRPRSLRQQQQQQYQQQQQQQQSRGQLATSVQIRPASQRVTTANKKESYRIIDTTNQYKIEKECQQDNNTRYSSPKSMIVDGRVTIIFESKVYHPRSQTNQIKTIAPSDNTTQDIKVSADNKAAKVQEDNTIDERPSEDQSAQ
eukprot:UN04703